MKILLIAQKPFAPTAVKAMNKIITDAGGTLIQAEKYDQKSKLPAAIKQADAVIIRSDPFGKEAFEAADKLKVVVRAGAGYDNIDLNAATQHNVSVMNTPGQNANAVAELVFGFIIYASRNFYNGSTGNELYGKKIGLHAFGNVSQQVARIANGFKMEIWSYDPFVSEKEMQKHNVNKIEAVDNLYSTCPIISLHIPATTQTKNSINQKLLSRMPENGLLINTARKEIINEHDLLAVMTNRPDLKFVTDIQPELNEIFRKNFSTRYYSTPKKTGAQTFEANENAGIAAAKQVIDYLINGNEPFRLNK